MRYSKIMVIMGLAIGWMNAEAANVDGSAVLGSAIGAAAGTAVGSAAGGKEGAIIGGGVGGALGAAIGSKDQPVRTQNVSGTQRVIYVDHHDNGKHKGEYKNKHHRGHDRD